MPFPLHTFISSGAEDMEMVTVALLLAQTELQASQVVRYDGWTAFGLLAVVVLGIGTYVGRYLIPELIGELKETRKTFTELAAKGVDKDVTITKDHAAALAVQRGDFAKLHGDLMAYFTNREREREKACSEEINRWEGLVRELHPSFRDDGEAR